MPSRFYKVSLLASLLIHAFGVGMLSVTFESDELGHKTGEEKVEVTFISVGPAKAASFSSSSDLSSPTSRLKEDRSTETLVSTMAETKPSKIDKNAEDRNENDQGSSSSSYSESALKNYLWEVRHRIETEKFYPTVAKRLRQQGVVEATFVINRDGAVVRIESLKADYESLASALNTLLTKKALFPSFPRELQADSLRVSLPIRFVLE